MTSLRLGTRRSALATTQSSWVADRLRALGHDVELVEVTTDGDRDRTTPLAQLGGTGVFVSALREALTDGRVDLAVHSLKDLPTAEDPSVEVAAVPVREDVRDALVAR
ncbi:MAG: hydroxymethylbilane synthase, partial [Micrococcales bacterium]|nr:hydroxymethylbilane synthase [Micrococcales bacterium]